MQRLYRPLHILFDGNLTATRKNLLRGDALDVLGVSRARKSRNPTVNVALLDRAYSALDLYARVASLIGTEHTPGWFRTPKEVLYGVRPVDLLETRVGVAKLAGMVTALEDGAFL